MDIETPDPSPKDNHPSNATHINMRVHIERPVQQQLKKLAMELDTSIAALMRTAAQMLLANPPPPPKRKTKEELAQARKDAKTADDIAEDILISR